MDKVTEDNIDSTIIYKLAALESSFAHMAKTIEDKFKQLEKKLDVHNEDVKKDFEHLETRVDKIEKWQDEIKNRIIGITLVVGIGWTIFGDFLRSMLEKIG